MMIARLDMNLMTGIYGTDQSAWVLGCEAVPRS